VTALWVNSAAREGVRATSVVSDIATAIESRSNVVAIVKGM
jgi:hypothetical protein